MVTYYQRLHDVEGMSIEHAVRAKRRRSDSGQCS